MCAALLTSTSPTVGVLRGHSWRCPHRILDGSDSPRKLEATQWNSLCTNSLYRNMKHSVTTALSWDQVLEFIIEPLRMLAPPDTCKRSYHSLVYSGAYINQLRSRMDRFHGRDPIYTMQYMWNRARSGIFVSIRNSRLELFVPFCNVNYTNTWTSDARAALPKKHLPPDRWWSNGWMLCEKCPSNFIGDTWVTTVGNMLMSACKAGMYDIDFIVNKRDTPCVRVDGADPMNPLDINLPSVVNPSALLPVLSFYTGAEYADISMPHPVDWQRVTGRYFAQASVRPPVQQRPDVYWEHKVPVAVFRGSMTGIGACKRTNQRAYLCSLQSKNLDARLTGVNARFKVDPFTRAISSAQRSDTAGAFMDIEDQQENFRYGVCIDGHSAVDRMGRLFNGRQAVLKVESPKCALAPHAWISDFLHAWEHYVPVSADLSDLDASICWLKERDDCASGMANRCKYMNKHYVCQEAIIDWWRLVSSL